MIVRMGLWAALTLICACDGGDGGDGGDGMQSDIQVQGDYDCCLNGSFYECNSAEAVSNCIDGDLSGCSAAGDC